jgi:hypothetical protein
MEAQAAATRLPGDQSRDEDVDMGGNTSEQPPNDWPVGKTEAWKSEHSPLTWDFTEEQNRRKIKWLKFLLDAPATKMSMEKLVGSLVLSEIIRQEWYGNPELMRQPKIVDMHHLLHPDRNNRSRFQNAEETYCMSAEQIENLHNDAFASTLPPSDTKKVIMLILDRGQTMG